MFTRNEANGYNLTAVLHKEKDGSTTVSLNEMDLAENAGTQATAIYKLAESIIEYAEDFYEEFEYWSTAPNRKAHIPYVQDAISQKDVKKLAAQIKIIPE